MISRDAAIDQFMRMSGLSFQPKGKGREELLEAIRTAATSAVAHHCVSTWLESQTAFPKPAEIRALIVSENERLQSEQRENARRIDWDESERRAKSPEGISQAKQDLIDLRALFVQRLATVDQRHAEQPVKRREWIKKQIEQMIAGIDAGKGYPGLVNQLADGDAYHSEW
jgi:hypothetical protein